MSRTSTMVLAKNKFAEASPTNRADKEDIRSMRGEMKMADMTFYGSIVDINEIRRVIIIPAKQYKGRQIASKKMCKIEITQIEE